MSPALVTGLVALGVAFLTGAFAFVTSRKTTDDSRAIGLINAGQVALEQALERATAEIIDLRQQIALQRKELVEVLKRHELCEDIRREQSREILRLGGTVDGRDEGG